MRKGFLYGMFGCFGVGAAIVIFVIVAAAIGGAGRGASSNKSSPAASASAKAAAKVLLDVQGSGTKSTQKFTAGGDWDLIWTYDCANFGTQGNFQVFLYGKDSSDIKGVVVNELGSKGSDTTNEHDAGTFFMKVNSECNWHITAKG